eukprot:5610412-Amphidinium_carterae.1
MPFSLTWDTVIPVDVAVRIALFSSVFWSIDMGFSFTTGYHTADGNAEMRLKKIAARYIRTWCRCAQSPYNQASVRGVAHISQEL